ncbi:flagellar motor protein MotA [Kordiimonas sp.]|uniref:flagellar motor protein MotA n=1 Tax=Kordiimonas sp. TaxID=1970157 RepID=UPI003A935068
MQTPRKFLMRMTLFLVAVLVLVALLRGPMIDAFMANIALNGVIVLTLLIGIGFAYRRVFDLTPEIEWITAFQRQEANRSAAAPRLLAPAASLLSAQEEGGMRLSTLSMRSVLDGIISRLEESREISRYFTGLLIFLGLLGTFWGLLGTIGAIGKTINGLTVDGGDMALMFDELKAGLEAPLSGMGTAFSSSLFGLAGSLILGFMDLQASQAQTRFYNSVEDWLASVTQLSRTEVSDGMASPNAYMTALMEQTADGIDRLQRTIKHSEDTRLQGQHTMTNIAESLATLADKLDAQSAHLQKGDEAFKMLATAIDKLATSHKAPPPAPANPVMDDATKGHIRNLDVGIKRLIDEQVRTSDNLVEELRAELKLLSRTIAASMDGGTGTVPGLHRPATMRGPQGTAKASGPSPKDYTAEPVAKPTGLSARRDEDDDA